MASCFCGQVTTHRLSSRTWGNISHCKSRLCWTTLFFFFPPAVVSECKWTCISCLLLENGMSLSHHALVIWFEIPRGWDYLKPSHVTELPKAHCSRLDPNKPISTQTKPCKQIISGFITRTVHEAKQTIRTMGGKNLLLARAVKLISWYLALIVAWWHSGYAKYTQFQRFIITTSFSLQQNTLVMKDGAAENWLGFIFLKYFYWSMSRRLWPAFEAFDVETLSLSLFFFNFFFVHYCKMFSLVC